MRASESTAYSSFYLSPVEFCPPATQAKVQRASAVTQCALSLALRRPQTFKSSVLAAKSTPCSSNTRPFHFQWR